MRDDVKVAVLGVYDAIDRARERQEASGKGDQGNRKGMTSGHHLDGIAELIRKDLIAVGLCPDEIHTDRGDTVLPGWFRPTKSWDFLAFHGHDLIAAIELKSINSSFGNNANNRVEEALGSVHDAIEAYKSDLFGNCAIPPVMGYVMLVRDTERSRRPGKGSISPHYAIDPVFDGVSYLDRFRIMCTRLRQKSLYQAVWLVYANPEEGTVVEPSADLSYAKFIATIKAAYDIHAA